MAYLVPPLKIYAKKTELLSGHDRLEKIYPTNLKKKGGT
jgi:hypothetical protein